MGQKWNYNDLYGKDWKAKCKPTTRNIRTGDEADPHHCDIDGGPRKTSCFEDNHHLGFCQAPVVVNGEVVKCAEVFTVFSQGCGTHKKSDEWNLEFVRAARGEQYVPQPKWNPSVFEKAGIPVKYWPAEWLSPQLSEKEELIKEAGGPDASYQTFEAIKKQRATKKKNQAQKERALQPGTDRVRNTRASRKEAKSKPACDGRTFLHDRKTVMKKRDNLGG